MINAKQKGARRERQCRKTMEEAGWWVMKAGGSLGLFDIVALGPMSILLIQVKSNRPPGKKEMQALEEFRAPAYAVKQVWIYKDGGKVEIRTLENG